MQLLSWKAPGGSDELAVKCGPQAAQALVLVLPAWFDEGNKTRHFTIAAMRLLAARGVASVLPDLPGCNESMAELADQSLASWRQAAHAAAEHFGCTHVLAIRAGLAIAPRLPGWAYAPLAGKSALRTLLRARVVSAREAGRSETTEGLLAHGEQHGLDLAGYRLGAAMVRDLARADLPAHSVAEIAQAQLGGAGLWLRAEPEHDQGQAERLAALVAQGLGA